MEEIKKRINQLLDSGLTGEKLVIALEKEIKNITPYQHSKRNPIEACGINDNIEFQIAANGTISEIVEKIEKNITKRKLAFMFLRKVIEEREGIEKAEEITQTRRQKAVDVESSKGSEEISDLESTVRNLMGYDRNTSKSSEKSPINCDETDDSECWKCKYNKNCSKKDSF